MEVFDRINRSLGNRTDDVFLRGEFDRFGSAAQVGRALGKLKQSGKLVQLGVGVYAKAKPSVLSGKPIPYRPLEELAPIALKKLGVTVRPGRRVIDYNTGRTTQVPSGVIVDVGKQRVTRKLGFNGKLVQYERS